MRLKLKCLLLCVLVTISCASYVIRNIVSTWSSGQHGSERNPIPNVKWPDLDPECSCRKVNPLESVPLLNRSTCGQYASDRGPGQKIIAFTFYGNLNSKYFAGIASNAASIQSSYPGYVMRLYFNKNSMRRDGLNKICDLFCKHPNVDLCDVGQIQQYPHLAKKFGMIWRFTPMADPLVEEWHSRDLDSKILQREVSAVQDWQQSQKSFHIMRDHPLHTVPILGGMFGMKIPKKNFPQMKRIFEDILNFVEDKWFKGLDQNALSALLWPEAQKDMVAHDSYHCHHFPSEHNRPWPTQRISGPDFSAPGEKNFVGNNDIFRTISMKTYGECPKQCRPKNYLDWLLC